MNDHSFHLFHDKFFTRGLPSMSLADVLRSSQECLHDGIAPKILIVDSPLNLEFLRTQILKGLENQAEFIVVNSTIIIISENYTDILNSLNDFSINTLSIFLNSQKADQYRKKDFAPIDEYFYLCFEENDTYQFNQIISSMNPADIQMSEDNKKHFYGFENLETLYSAYQEIIYQMNKIIWAIPAEVIIVQTFIQKPKLYYIKFIERDNNEVNRILSSFPTIIDIQRNVNNPNTNEISTFVGFNNLKYICDFFLTISNNHAVDSIETITEKVEDTIHSQNQNNIPNSNGNSNFSPNKSNEYCHNIDVKNLQTSKNFSNKKQYSYSENENSPNHKNTKFQNSFSSQENDQTNRNDEEKVPKIENPLKANNHDKTTFKAIPGLFYLYFSEKTHQIQPYQEKPKEMVFSVSPEDLQRNFHFLGDSNIYTFLGFKDRESQMAAIRSSGLLVVASRNIAYELKPKVIENYNKKLAKADLSKEKFVFQPIDNLFYIYFYEKPHGYSAHQFKPNTNLFGCEGIADVQRGFHFPNDHRAFTFLGFSSLDARKNANYPGIKANAIGFKIYTLNHEAFQSIHPKDSQSPNITNDNEQVSDKEAVFKPKEGLFYLYFIERFYVGEPSCEIPNSSLYTIKHISDLQRSYTFVNGDNTKYTFIGFSDMKSIKYNLYSNKVLRGNALNEIIKIYDCNETKSRNNEQDVNDKIYVLQDKSDQKEIEVEEEEDEEEENFEQIQESKRKLDSSNFETIEQQNSKLKILQQNLAHLINSELSQQKLQLECVRYNVFVPKENLCYIYFEEKENVRPKESIQSDKPLFRIKNLIDSQRSYYLPDSSSQKVYTFLGFSKRRFMMNAIETSNLKSNAVDQAIMEYIPLPSEESNFDTNSNPENIQKEVIQKPNNPSQQIQAVQKHVKRKKNPNNDFSKNPDLFYIQFTEKYPDKIKEGQTPFYDIYNIDDIQRMVIFEHSISTFIGFTSKPRASAIFKQLQNNTNEVCDVVPLFEIIDQNSYNNVSSMNNSNVQVQSSVIINQNHTQSNDKDMFFEPKNGFYYLYVVDSNKSAPAKFVKNYYYGVSNITDIQRQHILKSDGKKYTFLGFSSQNDLYLAKSLIGNSFPRNFIYENGTNIFMKIEKPEKCKTDNDKSIHYLIPKTNEIISSNKTSSHVLSVEKPPAPLPKPEATSDIIPRNSYTFEKPSSKNDQEFKKLTFENTHEIKPKIELSQKKILANETKASTKSEGFSVEKPIKKENPFDCTNRFESLKSESNYTQTPASKGNTYDIQPPIKKPPISLKPKTEEVNFIPKQDMFYLYFEEKDNKTKIINYKKSSLYGINSFSDLQRRKKLEDSNTLFTFIGFNTHEKLIDGINVLQERWIPDINIFENTEAYRNFMDEAKSGLIFVKKPGLRYFYFNEDDYILDYDSPNLGFNNVDDIQRNVNTENFTRKTYVGFKSHQYYLKAKKKLEENNKDNFIEIHHRVPFHQIIQNQMIFNYLLQNNLDYDYDDDEYY
ncbi:hypothetical protein TRFO_28793 [Tritrichomonas foetus]|uniref:Uncharacterized protein n=1 Tax=Tritrichomonas foetus TaxID=1144522 RepID=A0A1J4JXL0_9EUKA|nr:hypothetical protein TRFO_28793 [Tritrichomonas foetus]|eukprot:OHT03889.1 hypothetical protein TRFO_28793 [Tritrichomonas foetus]